MDSELLNAALFGDVRFLEEAFAVQPLEYFLARDDKEMSIFHIASLCDKVEFMEAAMKILPQHIVKLLLQSTDKDLITPLHMAALGRDISFIKCVREMYASFSWDDDDDHVKPWLALTVDNQTPLNLSLAINGTVEECAMDIMLMDPELMSCTIANICGNTPLYYAVEKGFSLVAENILKSPHPTTSILGSSDILSLLSLATNCTEKVVKLLLEKGDGCLDNDGNTPLHSAFSSTSTQELALEALSAYPVLLNIRNNRGESPFFLAVRSGYERVVGEIMRIEEPHFHMIRRNDGTTVLHILSSCPETTGKSLLEKYWWMINLRDDNAKTALDYAKQANALWLVNLLIKPSLIHKEDFNWIEACKREENLAVFAFVETCEDLQRDCLLKNDTLLHHIKLPYYKDYLNFLKNPSITELKNMTDHDGATALHRALERENIYLAKALLLDVEVKKTIEDYHGRTPMDLLGELCKKNREWDKMCKQIKVNPDLKTSYIQPGTNLEQIRNTLSVVAALLATITFAAGFTLPGGLNGDNGEALLAKKAGFLVFLLADVYAMCTSMLVLFSLIWSMVSETDMALLLVDRSVFLLMQSLYGTLLAFIAGIYTVIAHSSLWAAILILVMCSIIGISANRTILHKVISKLVPAADREKQNQTEMLEQELLEVRTER